MSKKRNKRLRKCNNLNYPIGNKVKKKNDLSSSWEKKLLSDLKKSQ